jgi:glycosyltransferase involved in cell wall biosynthesis
MVDQVTGLLVENSPAAMAEAIERLSADPSLARKLGSNARLAVKEKWNVNAAFDRLSRNLFNMRARVRPDPENAPMAIVQNLRRGRSGRL